MTHAWITGFMVRIIFCSRALIASFGELYGADSEIARRFYDKTIAAAAGEDRGQEFNNLMRPYYGRVNSAEDGYKILANTTFTTALSHF
jgi:hypothetical protein